MNIAIDYDGTLKRSSQIDEIECRMWGAIINAFRQFGHSVYIVTMRCNTLESAAEIAKFLNKSQVGHVDVIFCGEVGLKREVCKTKGIHVDIWIDDMPDTIGSLPMIGQASRVWGEPDAEGVQEHKK